MNVNLGRCWCFSCCAVVADQLEDDFLHTLFAVKLIYTFHRGINFVISFKLCKQIIVFYD